MNTPETAVAAQVDELVRRSSIHVVEHADHQALHAERILTDMLASIDRLTRYRARLRDSDGIRHRNLDQLVQLHL
jgi:hypothetical protein